MMKPVTGSVVRCIAGKEKDGYYVVTKVQEGFVLLADGRHRRLAKPKRKNVRHIRLTQTVVELQGMTDRALRMMLREYAAKGGN
ncbi:MAG: KOW domain-containing RNA-binding protein [Oscillospiraceae bacterium]|nr:KOW domain-containing RNA-binding protein [Oscillospiraceae bacterium]